jgi:hypothetical protein
MKKLLVPALAIGIPFGVLTGVGYSMEASVAESIFVGISFGVGAALAVALYAWWRDKRWNAWAAKKCAAYESEGVAHHGYAVLGSNAAALAAVAVGGGIGVLANQSGLLVLTGQRLIFDSLRSNVFGKQQHIALDDIVGARPAPYFGASTITIHTRAKQSIDIKVRDRESWLSKLSSAGVKVLDPARAKAAAARDRAL